MKSVKIVLLGFFVLLSTPFLSSQTVDIPSNVIAGFEQGDAGNISESFNNSIEMVVGNQDDVYSKQQASAILLDFFRKNRVTGFEIKHKGTKESASFVIAGLKTSTGNYRVYILIRKSQIQQLRIESSNE